MWLALLISALVAGYFIYGLLVSTPYRRCFATDLAPDEVIDGYLKPREFRDADENEISKCVSANIAGDTLRRQKFAGRDDQAFHEPHWGHTSGLLQGKLRINDVKALPEMFRVGLFARNAEYAVVARCGVALDRDLGFAVNRIAVKLKYPGAVPNVYAKTGEADELDLLLVEGESIEDGSGHEFFARDARQLDMATSLKPPSVKTLAILANWRNVAILVSVLNTVRHLMRPLRREPVNATGWAGKSYFSLGPFALGEGAMKFCLRPRQSHEMPPIDPLKRDPTGPHKKAMDAWLSKGRAAEFDLCVQLATPDCIGEPGPNDPPKGVMVAEYCDLHWDERRSPYIPVGRLVLKADDIINHPSQWAPMQFNAWNTLPEMRPLGQLFRVRKRAHAAHSNVRVSHLYGRTPGEMVGKCPFGR